MVKRIAKKFVTLLVVMLMLLQSYTSTAIAIQTSTPSKIWSEDPIKTKNESVTNQTSQEGKSSNTVITIDGENLEYPTGGGTSSNTETSSPKEEAKEETKDEPKDEPKEETKQTTGETILSVSLVLDVKDEYKNPVDGLEFRLLGKDGSQIKSVKTTRGLLILNDLKKGDYMLESSVIQPGYEKRNIKYSIHIGADGKIEVKDLVANKSINLDTARESLVAKDYTISITGEKLSDKDYSVKISLNADKADSIKGLNLISEVDKVFNLSDKSVKNADLSFDTGLLQIDNIKLDSNNNWSGKFTFSLEDSELEKGQDKKDLRHIFNNIYTMQADHKISGIGPVIYKGQMVDNKKLNIILKKTEDKTVSQSTETETKDKKTAIAEENLFRKLIPSNLETDIRDSLGNPMFMSMMDIYEGVVNRRGLEYRSSPRIFGPTLDVIEPGITAADANREGTGSSLTIYKKDDKGRALPGAVFKLASTDDKNNVQTVGENGNISTFVFSNIQHGSYLLTEEKAPQGYKKTDKKWDVYVASNGNVFISEKQDNIKPEVYKGRDVSGSLNGSLNLKVPQNGIEYGTENNNIKLELNLSINNANPGDYFDLTVSKNMHYNMLQPDKVSIPSIFADNEEIIAKPYLISSGLGEEKTVRYVFTDYVSGKKDIKISTKEINFSLDVYGAPNNGNQTFTAKIENSIIPPYTTQTQVTQKKLAEKGVVR